MEVWSKQAQPVCELPDPEIPESDPEGCVDDGEDPLPDPLPEPLPLLEPEPLIDPDPLIEADSLPESDDGLDCDELDCDELLELELFEDPCIEYDIINPF